MKRIQFFYQWRNILLLDIMILDVFVITALVKLMFLRWAIWYMGNLLQGALQHVTRPFFYTPLKLAGLYSDPFVRPFVRSFIRPSQSLIHYSSKSAEQNFMKLSGIVHYMMPYFTSYFIFFSSWFWGFPEQNKDFAIMTYGGGTHV